MDGNAAPGGAAIKNTLDHLGHASFCWPPPWLRQERGGTAGRREGEPADEGDKESSAPDTLVNVPPAVTLTPPALSPPVATPPDLAPLRAAIRARVEALLTQPDLPPGVGGGLGAVLAVAERFAAAGDRAMLEDLAGHVEEMPAQWERERRRREVRLSRFLSRVRIVPSRTVEADKRSAAN
jgi:hypothetical protein